MNPDTNHLVTEERLKQLPKKERGRYLPLPEDFLEAARRKLAGRLEATVSRRSGGKLSKWAAEQRAKQRAEAKAGKAKKAKRKMARESRRRNRRG